MRLPPLRLFLTGLAVTLGGSFHFGYELSIINPTEEVFKQFFNQSFHLHYDHYLSESNFKVFWSFVSGILFFGAFLGSATMPWIAETFGRRKGLFTSSLLFLIACLPSALSYHAKSLELFIIGRLLFGIAVGLATGLQGLYLSEISPTQHRGFIGALTGLTIETGLLFGSVIALPTVLGTDHLWPWIYWIEMVPSVPLLIVLCFSHESPTFLVSRDQEHQAKRSIHAYHGHEDSDKAEESIGVIRQDLELQRNSVSMWRLYKVKLARKGTLLGVLTNFAVSFSGVVALSFFATYLLTETGLSNLDATYANTGIAAAAFVSACISPYAVEHVGRKPLFVLACATLGILQVIMLIITALFDALQIKALSYAFLVANILFMLAFGSGMAPIPWFITTELVPQNAKAAAHGLAIMTQWITSFIAPIIFFPLQGAIGPYSFLLFIIPMLVLTIYFWRCLPETMNKSTNEVLQELYGDLAASDETLENY